MMPFEINDLSADGRFKDKFYVTDNPNLRYYYGLPLQTDGGNNIGALCVLDTQAKRDNAREKGNAEDYRS
jgi:GAF domain-containing protein